MRHRAMAVATLLLIAAAVFLPSPHPEARLFSDGWGAASFIDPDFCATSVDAGLPRLASFAKAPFAAHWQDRLALLANYLLWGLWLPIVAFAAFFRVYVAHDPARRSLRTPAALLLIFGLLGFAPAAIQWTLNPAFVMVRQAFAEWLLLHWSVSEDRLVWLDAAALVVWLGGGVLLLGGGVFAAVRGAARLVRIDWHVLATALVPLAGGLLFLGLTLDAALYLRGEGVPLDWLPGLRAAVLALAFGASVRHGIRRIRVGAGGTASKALAAIAWLLPLVFLAANAAFIYFRWTGRFHA